jgi:hypothetical protein
MRITALFFIIRIIVLSVTVSGISVGNIKSNERSTQSCRGNQTYNGSANLSGKQYNKLHINGTATLNDITIIDSLTIHGSLQATLLTAPIVKVNGTCTVNHSRANYMVISGAAHINHTVVDNETKVLGLLTASDSTFSNIIVNGKKTVLTNCRVNGNIIVTYNPSRSFEIFGWKLFESKSKETPIVELNNTIVNGTIIFVSSKGIVTASGGNHPACQNGLVAWEPTR